MKMTYMIYPKFVEDVKRADILRWARALEQAEKDGIRQMRGGMFAANQYGKFMCCLMVGHKEFGGTNEGRDEYLPNKHSPLTKAFNGDVSPYIATYTSPDKTVFTFTGADLNDDEELTFKQIATLLRKGKVTVSTRI